MTLASPSTTRPSATRIRVRAAGLRPGAALIGYGIAGTVSLTIWAAAFALVTRLIG
ncbi:MAG: hypothetical protein K2X25_06270 [Caulobacteraceae bacterium]|nr:hypothetical protein [Caulobacteraceae bacterium]